MEKPRYIIVGFQTNKKTQETNPALFDNLNLSSAYLQLNSCTYPKLDYENNFTTNNYAALYSLFDNFKKEYDGVNSLIGGSQVSYPAFKSLFPILVFDVRHQNEKIKPGVVDIMLQFKFREAVPADTTAYAFIISDKFYKLRSDGKNLTMVTN